MTREISSSKRCRARALLVALPLLAWAAPAAGVNDMNPFRIAPDIWVYYDKDGSGFDAYTATVPLGIHTIDLRVTAGEIASLGGETLCTLPAGATGQELCALDVQIQVTGPGVITGFAAETGLGLVPFIQPDGKTMSIAFSTLTNPFPTPFPPQRLGALTVDITGNNAVVAVTGNSGIGPNSVDVKTALSNIVLVPEPGVPLLLASGVGGLLGLHRLRRRRAAR